MKLLLVLAGVLALVAAPLLTTGLAGSQSLSAWQGTMRVCLSDVSGTACELYYSTTLYPTRERCQIAMTSYASRLHDVARRERVRVSVTTACSALPMA